MKSKPILIDLIVIILLFGIMWLVSWVSGEKRAEKETNPPEVAVEVPAVGQSEVEADPGPPRSYDAHVGEDHALAGIAIGDTAEEVRAALGEPKSTKTNIEPFHYNPQFTERRDIWTYDGVEIVFSCIAGEGDPPLDNPGDVQIVTVTSGQYESILGLRIGDSWEKCREIYPDPLTGEDGIGAFELAISIEDGVVSQLQFFQVPD